MPRNSHGVDTDQVQPGTVVRCQQGGDPRDGGGRIRTVRVDQRTGGRLTATTVDNLEPQGSTDLLHVDDITGVGR